MEFVITSRLRKNSSIRDLIKQTKLEASSLIMPYFVREGIRKKEPIKFFPGVYQLSIDNLVDDIKEAMGLGIKAILLFGVSDKKDAYGTEGYNHNGIVQRALRSIKKNVKDITVITDVCLCGYTLSGHCGIIKGQGSRAKGQGEFGIDIDKTLEALSKIAVSHAEAGADFAAPSAMMDGQVKTIRSALDKNKFNDTGILAYSAKYASNFYGPFREALDSNPRFGSRKSYQLDFRDSNQALREIEEDIREGADIIMIKPALAYLDIIAKARQSFKAPIAAYNVSGEYSLVKLAAQKGAFEEKEIILEILTAIKRAGADLIITYHAKEAAGCLRV